MERRTQFPASPSVQSIDKAQKSCKFYPKLLQTFLHFSKKIQNNAKKHKRNCKKERTFALIYPLKAAFLHLFAGFSIPFASFINCFMQNKPNSKTYAETKSKSRRAGKPNFTINTSSPTSLNGPRVTGHGSRITAHTPRLTSHDLFKTNPIPKLQESCIENYAKQTQLQFTHSPFNSFTHLLFYAKQTQSSTTERQETSDERRTNVKRTQFLSPTHERNTKKTQILPNFSILFCN